MGESPPGEPGWERWSRAALRRSAGGSRTVRRRALNRVLLALPPGARRRAQYLLAHGRLAHLRDPQRWSEKVNWRMLHDRRPLIAMTCDKQAAAQFVLRTAVPGTVRLPRTVWSGEDPAGLADVDWPARWVLKSNHGTGAVVPGVGTPDPARRRDLQASAARWLTGPGPERWGEWGYAQARRRVVLEEALPGTGDAGIADHKFFVVGGEVRLVQVDTDRFTHHRRRFHRPDWTPLDVVCEVPLGPVGEPPATLATMLEVAERLGAAFDAIRVDLYEAAGEVWFGELTAYSGSGLSPFRPSGLDRELGEGWVLPR